AVYPLPTRRQRRRPFGVGVAAVAREDARTPRCRRFWERGGRAAAVWSAPPLEATVSRVGAAAAPWGSRGVSCALILRSRPKLPRCPRRVESCGAWRVASPDWRSPCRAGGAGNCLPPRRRAVDTWSL